MSTMMTQLNNKSQEPELFLPKFCMVPLQARLNNNLKDAEKIYLGELNVLTNKFGYCFATDEQLAQMKGVSLRCIKSWHTNLEKEGFIQREVTRHHYTLPDRPGVFVRTERKIYVFEEGLNRISGPEKQNNCCDSKKVAEGQICAPRSEGQICAPRSEGQICALINKEPLKEEHKDNNRTPTKEEVRIASTESSPKAPSAVEVVFELKNLDIPQSLKIKLSEKYSPDELRSAIARLWPGCKDVAAGLIDILKNPEKYEKSTKNQEESNKSLSDKIEAEAEYPLRQRGWRVESLSNDLIFYPDGGVSPPITALSYSDPLFKTKLTVFLKEKNLTEVFKDYEEIFLTS